MCPLYMLLTSHWTPSSSLKEKAPVWLWSLFSCSFLLYISTRMNLRPFKHLFILQFHEHADKFSSVINYAVLGAICHLYLQNQFHCEQFPEHLFPHPINKFCEAYHILFGLLGNVTKIIFSSPAGGRRVPSLCLWPQGATSRQSPTCCRRAVYETTFVQCSIFLHAFFNFSN